MTEGTNDGRFGRRGWLGLLVGLTVAAVFVGGPSALSIWLRGGADHSVHLPSHSTSPTFTPSPTGTQWACAVDPQTRDVDDCWPATP